jgi:hypothetical protein
MEQGNNHSTGSQAQAGIRLEKEERAHTLSSASQHTLHTQLSSSLQAELEMMMTIVSPIQKSDRNSHVPWARLL